jgi:protein-S-isoprenylcysteine O-methyltransferase Ste14
MKTLALVFLIFCYGQFIHFALFYFRTPDDAAKRSKTAVAILGTLSMLLQILAVLSSEANQGAVMAVGFFFVCSAIALFSWIKRTLKKVRLSFAFSDVSSTNLLTDGPYGYVRHPIYLAYILCWVGGFFLAPSWISAFPLGVMIPLYLFAIFKEERQFLSRALAGQYSEYRKKTGCLVPRLFR